VTSRQGICSAATGSGAGRGRRANRTFHDQIDVTGLGERSNTDGVDMTMKRRCGPGMIVARCVESSPAGQFGKSRIDHRALIDPKST
jgi:hypothetical protein